MATKPATTWSAAAKAGKPGTAPAEDDAKRTDPVAIKSADITVELNDDGDEVTLTLGDAAFSLDLDTVTDLAGQLGDVSPDIDTGKGAPDEPTE